MEMVGVRQLNLAFDLLKVLRGYCSFDCGYGSDVHEDRSLDVTVDGMEDASLGAAFLFS